MEECARAYTVIRVPDPGRSRCPAKRWGWPLMQAAGEFSPAERQRDRCGTAARSARAAW